jgi:ferrochelatase
MGGPDKLDDVEPFLLNLFSDREIIRLGPKFMQKFIARRIAKKRAPKSAANYAKIGSGSPMRKITAAQVTALQEALHSEGDYTVDMGMRYWHPRTDITLERMLKTGIERLIALPLYPQYSIATSGSSLNDLQRTVQLQAPNLDVTIIRSWPESPEYIDCLASRAREGLDRFDGDKAQLVYSAHSLPKKFVDEGDPYVEQTRQTISALEKKTGITGELCFQSRSGPVQWLEPSTPDMLEQLAAKGCRNILMMPISFVSDHIETLYEIDMLFKEQAAVLGMRLESTRALNADADFIAALKEIILKAQRSSKASG